MSSTNTEAIAAFDAAAWNRQQYTIQRIRTDSGFQNYFRSLQNGFDSVTARDLTCGDERILGPRVTLPGCGILQSDAELVSTAIALRATRVPLGSVRRHWQCGAERLSGFNEEEITERLKLIAEIMEMPLGEPAQMLPIDGKIARAAVVAGHPFVNPCAFEDITPFFCSAVSASIADDVSRYMQLSLAAMPGRFTAQDPFVVAIVGDVTSPDTCVAPLRSRIAASPGIAELWRTGSLVIVGADF